MLALHVPEHPNCAEWDFSLDFGLLNGKQTSVEIPSNQVVDSGTFTEKVLETPFLFGWQKSIKRLKLSSRLQSTYLKAERVL